MSDERSEEGIDCIRLLADQEIPVGTEVLIPKGTEWKSTHPTQNCGITKRTTRLKVQTSSSRWTADLTWAGTGGYWRWCPKVNCFYFPDNVKGDPRPSEDQASLPPETPDTLLNSDGGKSSGPPSC